MNVATSVLIISNGCVAISHNGSRKTFQNLFYLFPMSDVELHYPGFYDLVVLKSIVVNFFSFSESGKV